LHDLLHEYFHASQNPDLEEHPVIEEDEMAPERRNSREELAANRFAGDVMLDCRAEQLAEDCVTAAAGRVERLKSVVPVVAEKAGVSLDALANYMAFRLSLQDINWWGTATNLQSQGVSQMSTPREILLSEANVSVLNPIDRDLLLRALEPSVLGFAGKVGSGKSTVSARVAEALAWPRASFGDYLREVARSKGLDGSREVLQELGASLVQSGPDEFCRALLTHCGWSAGEPLVVDGIRHEEVANALRRLVAPLELRLIFMETDDRLRHERLRERDSATSEKLERIESHSTEQQAKERLAGVADLCLQGDRPLSELVSTVLNWVHQGNGTQNHSRV
jgi:dephospho-CoA kinase